MGTTGPSSSYTGQGMAHSLVPRSNHYHLVSPFLPAIKLFIMNNLQLLLYMLMMLRWSGPFSHLKNALTLVNPFLRYANWWNH